MTQPWNWHENMADLNQHVNSSLITFYSPRHHWMKLHEYILSFFLCEFVNSETMFMQQKWRMATIDFVAMAISGKLFERYDYDEYQK